MIAHRSSILNLDYIVISSFVERMFTRELKMYVSHIRKFLAVTQRSVVLRSKNVMLRAALMAWTFNEFVEWANWDDYNGGYPDTIDDWYVFCKTSRLYYVPRLLKLHSMQYKRKHDLQRTAPLGVYIHNNKLAAPATTKQTLVLWATLTSLQNRLLCNNTYMIQAFVDINGGIPPLYSKYKDIRMYHVYKPFKQRASSNVKGALLKQTICDFVQCTVLANTLQRQALCYTRFYRNWRRGFASLPVKRELYTVLRSPHTDKKSREQFKYEYRRKIKSYPSFISIMTKRYVSDRLTAGLGVKSKQTHIIYL